MSTKSFVYRGFRSFDDTIDDASGIVIRSEILMAASRDEWDLPMRDFKKSVTTVTING